MSREIKFRAWDNYSKSFVEDDEYLIGLNGKFYRMDFYSGIENYEDGNLIWNELDNITLSQFTGLLDANENPIFIGDILSSKEYYNNDLDANYKRVGEVKFNDGYNYFDVGYYLDGFEFKNGKVWRKFRNDLVKAKYDINGNYNLKPISNGGYIIGNLYQNPELLGGQDEQTA